MESPGPQDPISRSNDAQTQEDKRSRKTKRTAGQTKASTGARFFLAAGDAAKPDSLPTLGEEFPDADKALVASFQKNLPFYRVETWKAHAERKGRYIVLRPNS